MTQKEYKKNYKEIEVIGRGNFGSATLVERYDTKKQYIAKKIVLSSLNAKQQDGALQEAQLLKDLNHKNIVAYVESFKEDELLIIIMEYCEHGDLAFHIKRKKQNKQYFPEILVVNWFYDLALSIKYIHEKKILHRDIKTSNIFLTKDGTIKIGDFGISKVLENTQSVANTVVGTPYYMSPEVCESKSYTYKSDIWALGCVLYELCALQHAFESNNLLGLFYKIVKENVSDIPSFYSKELNELIHKMLTKNEPERPIIHDILNDISAQKLFKQYLEVKGDPQQGKSENASHHQKKPSNQNQNQLSNVTDGKGTNKENNAVNQLILTNQNDKVSMLKNNLQDTSSPMNTVDSQMYQVNPHQVQIHHQSLDHREEPEYIIKQKIIKRNVYTPDVLNNKRSNNSSNGQTENNSHNQIETHSNKEQQDINDGTHDEYYYHDDDQSAFKQKRDRFDEGAAIIKQNNYLKQDSPTSLHKVRSQQTFNHPSKFKKEDGFKQVEMQLVQKAPKLVDHQFPHSTVAASTYQKNHSTHQSHMYQQNINQQEYLNQQFNNPIMSKLTPKQLAQLKKEEKSRLQLEQITEYMKSQQKNSLISRERYIQNVYGEKFLPNQSSLKQYEDNNLHNKQQKNQLHLEPIGQKSLLKNNFMMDRNQSPSHPHLQTNFMMIDTQYQQDIPLPVRSGSQKSPTQLRQVIKQQNIDDAKNNANIYQEMDYPIESTDKFSISTQINNRRKNNGSKNDVMTLLQEEDQQKQYYNQIHKNVPSYKSQFGHIPGLPQRTSSLKFHTQQDELAESQAFDHQYYVNKMNGLKSSKSAKYPQQQQQQDVGGSVSNNQGGVSISNTQFESEINLESTRHNNGTMYQDIPLPNVKRVDTEKLSPSPAQISFESFFSKEDLSDQGVENVRPLSNSKGSTYKIRNKPANPSNFKGQLKLSKQETQDDEYGSEQFEDYFSDEDAEYKKQNRLQQNNGSNDSLKNRKNSRDQVRKLSNFQNNIQSIKLEAIAENDCEQTQTNLLQQVSGTPKLVASQSARKVSSGIPSLNKVDSGNQDSQMKGSKKLSHQNSTYSTDDQPPSRLSNNHSRNSPKNSVHDSGFKNGNPNSQTNQNYSNIANLRQKCKQNLGYHFDKVYDIIEKSIQQNGQNYNNKMKKQLEDVVGKQRINECFDVEQLIFKEQELNYK